MSDHGFHLYGYLMIHTAIRRQLARYEEQARHAGASNASSLLKKFEFHWKIVEVHHQLEDNLFFPDLAKRSTEFADALTRLSADHHEVDNMVEQIKNALGRAASGKSKSESEIAYQQSIQILARFREVLEDHLGREENIVIPTVSKNYPAEEQVAMEGQLFEVTPPEHMAIEFPWVFEILNEQEKEAALAGLPAPISDLLVNTWNKEYREFMDSLAA